MRVINSNSGNREAEGASIILACRFVVVESFFPRDFYFSLSVWIMKTEATSRCQVFFLNLVLSYKVNSKYLCSENISRKQCFLRAIYRRCLLSMGVDATLRNSTEIGMALSNFTLTSKCKVLILHIVLFLIFIFFLTFF